MRKFKKYDYRNLYNLRKPRNNFIFKIDKRKYPINKAEQIKLKIKINKFIKQDKKLIFDTPSYRFNLFNDYVSMYRVLNKMRETEKYSKQRGSLYILIKIIDAIEKANLKSLSKKTRSEDIYEEERRYKEKQENKRTNKDGSINDEVIIS